MDIFQALNNIYTVVIVKDGWGKDKPRAHVLTTEEYKRRVDEFKDVLETNTFDFETQAKIWARQREEEFAEEARNAKKEKEKKEDPNDGS